MIYSVMQNPSHSYGMVTNTHIESHSHS